MRDTLNKTNFQKSPTTEQVLTVIKPISGLVPIDFRSLWLYRNFLYFLVWRDIKIKYKQTVMGLAWAVLKPLGVMLIFTVIMSVFAGMPSDNIPYAIFLYAALLPWNYWSDTVGVGSVSLLTNGNLVSKINFPRLIVPISCVFPPLVDFFVSFIVLLGLMAWYHIAPTWALVFLPLFVVYDMIIALAVVVWFSAVNVKYRDVAHSIAFIVQFLLFASPILYPSSMIPKRFQLLYSLNPIYGVIEGFRWTLLGKARPDLLPLLASASLVIILLFGGLLYFRRVESTFADVM